MLGLINTRPIWNDEDNDLWTQNLRSELSSSYALLNAPLQRLSLKNSENFVNDFDNWLQCFSLNQTSGYMIFTSPASVKALIKHLYSFQNTKKKFCHLEPNHTSITQRLTVAIQDQRLKVATIGVGTKNQLTEQINKLVKSKSISSNCFLNEVIHAENNADSSSFLDLHKEKLANTNLLILEGEGNKPTLEHGLKTISTNVNKIVLYERETCNFPPLFKFYNKVFRKNKPPKGVLNFNKKIFLLLSSSTIANLAKKELKKQKIELSSLIVLSHHDRIINVMRTDCQNLKFARILSLNPRLIADELKKY